MYTLSINLISFCSTYFLRLINTRKDRCLPSGLEDVLINSYTTCKCEKASFNDGC